MYVYNKHRVNSYMRSQFPRSILYTIGTNDYATRVQIMEKCRVLVQIIILTYANVIK